MNTLHNRFAATMILAASLSFTVAAYYYSYRSAAKVVEDRFDFRAGEVVHAIQARMDVYKSVLRGVVGLFEASEYVSRDEFRRYVDSLDLEKRWPGVQGIGFAVPLQPEELADHVSTIRAEGFSDYNIHPAGDRKEYSAIVYLEPFDWRNQRAFGFDMWSNDIRRAAMEHARDSGRASASGMITLVQETEKDRQHGFLTYVPLYGKDRLRDTVEQRRDALLGWIYAPFRADDLMQGVLGSGDSNLQFFIYDGEQPAADNLLFASDTRKFDQPDFVKTVPVEIQGRTWIVEFRAPNGLIAAQISGLPTFVAVAAGAVDLLLFYVMFSIQYLQRKAQGMAENMTTELRDKSADLEQTKIELEQKLIDLEMAQAKLIETSNLASLGEMAGGIAHEINNPLTIINGYLDRLLLLASRNRLMTEEMQKLVDAAQKTVFRIRGIVNGLRNFSRDSQHESLTTTRVGDIIEETLDLCREKFRNHAVDLKVEGALTTEVCCRKLQISQVLINLLNNAFQAVRDAAVKEVRIDVQEAGPDILIAVTDSGPGIPAGLQHKMFQPFFTTKEVGQGTGLGLSISKGLIESQNGSLQFDPSSPRTRFVVRLPRTQVVRQSA